MGVRRHRRRARPTISVVCATHHPAALVGRALERVVAIADEVVIAADARVGPRDLRGYEAVADVVARFPFTGANRFRPWLRTLAEGDWLLLLDGDETPGADLVDALRDVVRDRTCAGFALPCRWVHPDGARWLTDEPWGSDRHLRLVRNDDRLWFPGEKHTEAVTTGPVRRLDAPFYHLDLAVTDEAARRRKVERYRAESTPLLTTGGEEANAAYYLPEDRPDAAAAALPDADAAIVRSVLTAAAAGRTEGGGLSLRRRPVVPRAELGRIHPRVHDASPYAAATRIRRAPAEAPAGSVFEVEVVVRNVGDADIPVAAPQLGDLRLSYHWTRPDGATLVHDGRRTPLPHRLPRGEEAPMTLVVRAPDAEGRCRLVVDLVHEGRRWLGAEAAADVALSRSVLSLLRDAAGADGRVPVEACWRVRRRLDRPDALAEAVAPDDPAGAPPEPLDGPLAAAGAAGAALVVGAGPRILDALERRAAAGGAFPAAVVVDSAAREAWCRAEVARRGLDGVVRTLRAAGDDPAWDPGAVREALGGRPVAAMLVGGPAELGRPLRDACAPAARPLVAGPAPVVMLDALTDAALLAADAWRGAGVAVHGVRPGPPALLEAQLTPG